jgi:hypothetical protein
LKGGTFVSAFFVFKIKIIDFQASPFGACLVVRQGGLRGRTIKIVLNTDNQYDNLFIGKVYDINEKLIK